MTRNEIPAPVVGPNYEVFPGYLSYHGGGRSIDPVTREHPFRIGFEVEKVDCTFQQDIKDAQYVLPRGWRCEHDGSLSTGGFEMVSRAYNLEWEEQIAADFILAADALDSGSDNTCGGHIHISDGRFTPHEFADRIKPLFPLLMVLYPARMRSNYVRVTKFKAMRANSMYDPKYSPFFIKNTSTVGATIELRIFSGVKKRAQLEWRAKLLAYFMRASQEKPLSFNWMMQELTNGKVREMLAEVYRDDVLESKTVIYWSMASFFYTDRPVHEVLQPIMRRIPPSYISAIQ